MGAVIKYLFLNYFTRTRQLIDFYSIREWNRPYFIFKQLILKLFLVKLEIIDVKISKKNISSMIFENLLCSFEQTNWENLLLPF